VLANPADCPHQTYSWYVDAALTVCSFVDVLPGGGFGGVPAPLLQLVLEGEQSRVLAVEPESAA
jgi:levansucrase